MTNVFKDIDTFATACDQPPSEANYKMYLGLIDEEVGELADAIEDNDPVEQLDALIDILVVTMGAVRAAGWDGEATTGKVIKREDGKVLKPEGWKAPELAQFIK